MLVKACAGLLASACALLLAGVAACAQDFPSKPVRLIVPFAAGRAGRCACPRIG